MSCKGPHWRRDYPPRPRPQGSDSQNNRDWRCPGVPTQVLITPEEPQVLITVEGQSIHFLLDTLGQFSLCSLQPLAHFPLDPVPWWRIHQWMASHGGFLHFKERALLTCVNTFINNNHMWCLFMIWWHLTILRWTGITHCTLTVDIMWLLMISTWFSDYFALYLELYNGICFCLKVFRLQMIVHAPTISVASSNYYLGPLDQRPSVWG